MSFTAKDVATLREMTGAGMMDCKKALQEVNGNMDEAVSYLRKKGIASAAKKAGNIAAEGALVAKIADDKKSAVIVEVNSQTDFVAKNDNFKAFIAEVATVALTNKTKNIASLLAADLGGKAIADAAIEQTAKTGEKIDVRRVAFVETTGIVGCYVHPVGSKVGSLVVISGAGATAEQANDIAMHVAAANPAPEFATMDEIPADVVAKEKEIEASKDDLKGKPAEIVEKIVGGRVAKLLAARVLTEQPFVKDPSLTVAKYLGGAKLESFVRLNLGEGIERKESNFAEEVAAMAAGKV